MFSFGFRLALQDTQQCLSSTTYTFRSTEDSGYELLELMGPHDMNREARSLEEQLFCFWQNLVDFTRRDRACELGRRHLQTKASVRKS